MSWLQIISQCYLLMDSLEPIVPEKIRKVRVRKNKKSGLELNFSKTLNKASIFCTFRIILTILMPRLPEHLIFELERNHSTIASNSVALSDILHDCMLR